MRKITQDNFITDDKTDIVYFSSLVSKESSGFQKDIREILYEKLKESLYYCKYEELTNTRDVWARDYMPIQITNDLFLDYVYSPDYLNNQKDCITNWELHKVHTKSTPSFNFDKVLAPLVLDGGNVIKAIDKFGKPTIIMCDKVLKENNLTAKELSEWWDKFFENQIRLLLIEWEGEKLNPIGHADGMVRYIKPGKLLLTNYCDFEDEERLTAPLEQYFDFERLHFNDVQGISGTKLWSLMMTRSWCYINFLQVGNNIIVPSLGYTKLDQAALTQIANAFGSGYVINMINIDMSDIIEAPEDYNGGGGLNCMTWTIKQ